MNTATRSSVFLLCALLAVGLPALAQPAKPPASDAEAMKRLARANVAEIETGQLADTRAETEPVKQFGQRMVRDHPALLQDLKALAQAKGVALPDDPPKKGQKKEKKLSAMPRDKFDERYMQMMLKEHEKAVKETENIAKTAQDPKFKAAVEHANRVMREHLQIAKEIVGQQSAAAGSSKAGSSK